MNFRESLFPAICIPSLMLGLMFFSMSLTPSLIPRDAIVQGILGGLVTAIGYLCGRIVALVWRAADLPRLLRPVARIVLLLWSGAALALFAFALTSSLTWQNDLRVRMGMETVESLNVIKVLGVALATFVFAYAIGAGVAALFRVIRLRLHRIMPPRRANVLGFVTGALILVIVTRDGIFDHVVTGLDESYEAAQLLFDSAPPLPSEKPITGSAASLVDWKRMGQPGRDFMTSGPDADAIAAFTGKPALDPIRIYVGRANGSTPEERAELALAELKRTGAFSRKVLIVTSPTGTGWMDPGAHDTVEYMHGGDIATVATQYSYLQSPLALILETNSGLEQASATLAAVHEFWKTLPRDARPRLYVHGLSLGAWSSMFATNLFRLVGDPIDGAFWAGPPFPSNFWNYAQNARESGSSWVLPKIGDGSLVRYASHVADASEAEAEWGSMRIVFLQYASDPIVFYDPYSFWRAPPWMNEPPADDVSAHLRFMPIVTQFQLALDMALSFGAPAGHGHAYYAQDYIAPWAQVTAPEGWSAEDTRRLKAHCDNGFQNGCSND
ncbi:alpha/beta-hydrolase family protein [Hoeflea sp.]|uniref:alpha/beta hydrolase n=1 Tax=Hoeflea sp. TaxID=1940281 RepID=UPI00198B3CE9|nr:alpha/beta-hydrolase family protein [Hoeflea sp.]MBC7281452.1 alpha/beta-hydrolase family protein [Hoeflea sp.]